MTTARGSVRVEPGQKRLRVYLAGHAVADTTHPLLVWESPHYPTYYFPAEDVTKDLLEPDGDIAHSPSRGDAQKLTVKAAGREAPGAALRYDESPIEELRGHIRFDWDAMDSWFEEDEEVFVHARSPYTRIDILPSSRHIRVEVDGVTVAESSSAQLLFETGLPTRYYFPKTHVRMDRLEPIDTVTRCPYKGFAEYWAIRVGDQVHRDLAWSYRTPLPESEKVAGLIAFYKVDIYVDGVLQPR
jgi:uncharacterized protein (DUF427 family)